MTIERRYKGAFNVYVETNYGKTYIDTVYWAPATIDEVRRSLIDHDSYDPNIIVLPEEGTMLPLTVSELEELCDDNDIRRVQANEPEVLGRWDWLDSEGFNASDMSFETEEEAMRNAVEVLELESQTYEAIED